jgi:UDP-glucose 4-epimerase
MARARKHANCLEAAPIPTLWDYLRYGPTSGDERLVFMSSSSVYSGVAGDATEDLRLSRPETCYDETMYERDLYAAAAQKDCYGLRLGTVCGASPNLRSDLMLNKMYLDATNSGVIRVANPERSRPILAMTDLCRAVHRLVQWPQRVPGIYNVASFNSTIGELAAETARLLNAVVKLLPPSSGYDMRISTEKFSRCFDFPFQGTIASILDDLASARPNHVAARHAGADAVHPGR